jgi:ABC-2 type transport system ATP-binding protein
MTQLIELDNLYKYYGQFEALKGISLEVTGQSIGLLGPNGAGKSTLVRSLLGLLPFQAGTATVMGHVVPDELDKLKPRLGYMPEHECLIPSLNAVDFISFMARLSGLPQSEAVSRAHESLEYVGLQEARYRRLSEFSGGMKQRVKLAQAIVHGPDIVFLDEPTNGLDPSGRDEMLSLVEDIQSRDIHIVFSSHILPDIEQVCDQIIILQEGKLRYCGSLDRLTTRDESVIEVKTNHQNEAFARHLEEAGFNIELNGPYLEIQQIENTEETSRRLFEVASKNDIQIRHYLPSHLTLEKAFIDMMDRPD